VSTDTELSRLLHSVVPEPPPLPLLASAVRHAARRRRTSRVAATALALVAVAAAALLAWPRPDPRAVDAPTPVTAGPPALACPAARSPLPRSARVTNHGPLVPGNPTRLTVCLYAGLNAPHPGSLAGHWVLDAQEAAPFSADLNSSRPPMSGVHGCPMDDGSTALLLFQYRDGHPVWVTMSLTGCRTIDNGVKLAWDPDGQIPGLISRLR
jgi:hypothetical protein